MENISIENPTNKSNHYEYSHPVVKIIAHLIETGFENPEGLSGSCQLKLTDSNDNYCLLIKFSKGSLSVTESVSYADATIIMPVVIAEIIARDINAVDFRDTMIMENLTMSGDLSIVNQIGKSLVRPSKITQLTLSDATDTYREAYKITELPYLDAPCELTILETLASKTPFVIRNAPVNSDVYDWNLTTLKTAYNDTLLRVRSASSRETVGQFIDRMQNLDPSQEIIEGHTKVYTEGCRLPDEMVKDFLPGYFTRYDYTDPQIWLGSVPTDVPASSLHRDPLDGFLYQIWGRKKVMLFSPDQAKLLYPMKAYNNYQPCWVKPEAPDFKKFPLSRDAKLIEVVLQPGEILVQPAGWFHAVYCLDSPTFSVSYFLAMPTGVELPDDA